MAIETGAIFKKLYFDGTSSGDYGVYISGAGTFNAPKRDVEMVSIPGRNGDLALDKGRFENIEGTYKAGLFGVDESDFAEAISDFRNFLCSRKGYVRLEDEYNPNEYRMAVYKSGLDVDVKQLKAGEFEIVFDCKPQRWLKSGEAAVTVASGDTLENPTLFDASPLLEVEGHGTIVLNGYEIEFDNGLYGETELIPTTAFRGSKTFSLPSNIYASGDTMVFNGASIRWLITARGTTMSTWSVVSSSGADTTIIGRVANGVIELQTIFAATSFPAGTDYAYTGTAEIRLGGTAAGTYTMNVTLTFAYDATAQTFQFFYRYSGAAQHYYMGSVNTRMKSLTVDSTVYALGHPTYVDCERGDAYKIEDGVAVSLNRHIDLGSDLPKLKSGTNEVTYSGAVEELKIQPRWWKI